VSAQYVEHRGFGGQILHFEQNASIYRVNRRQSLLLATNALVEALDMSAITGLHLKELRAWEPCCGGAPAAIVLKGAGLSSVEASDVDPKALIACRRNQELNGLSLDRISEFDVLGTTSPATEPFDLIVCNPPCRPTELIPDRFPATLRRAIDGGSNGCQFYCHLIERARHWLRPGGRLVLTLTSTLEISTVVRSLDVFFPGAWRPTYATPVAHPFAQKTAPEAIRALTLAAHGKILIWVGQDNWLHRLSWVITAIAEPPQATARGGVQGLSFSSYGGDPVEPAFEVAVARFLESS
jgi:release factor glutamine methyltransferase